MGHKLDLGCGSHKVDSGHIGVDHSAACHPDVVHDLTTGIPFQDNSVDAVFSSHFYEHLTESQGVLLLSEILRVCHRGATVTIKLPLNFPDPAHFQILGYDWLKVFFPLSHTGKTYKLCSYLVETIRTTSIRADNFGTQFEYEQATVKLTVV